jgi:hypothetical protein
VATEDESNDSQDASNGSHPNRFDTKQLEPAWREALDALSEVCGSQVIQRVNMLVWRAQWASDERDREELLALALAELNNANWPDHELGRLIRALSPAPSVRSEAILRAEERRAELGPIPSKEDVRALEHQLSEYEREHPPRERSGARKRG